MKHGFRKPSIRKSIAARTVGKAKRELMKSIIPGYGTRGMGKIHPIRSAYNKLYKQTTFEISDLNKSHSSNISRSYSTISNNSENKVIDSYAKKIQSEIDKINKKDDYDFFVYLNYLYKSIEALRNFESQYSYNHFHSDEMKDYLNRNKDIFINRYLYRYYDKIVNKIKTLKTKNARINNINQFSYTINSNKQFFNEQNSEVAEELNSNLLQIYDKIMEE